MKAEPPQPDPDAVEAIFNAALGFAPAARSAYVAGACGHNIPLRERVEALLRAHEAAVGFLPEQSNGQARALLPVTEKPGDRIGHYKLLQQIGEGGCGVVYMAEQEEPVRRRVALKVIKLGMDTKSVIARFEAERQALALMDHPSIAKVLDAGATDTGRPYFVMELVRGTKITDYCDQNGLSMRERLDLFIQVCHAIQHAHQKGIIHRDIKPSNILVSLHDGVPVPVVIDFGIAKATEQRLTDKTLFTAFEQFIGTPAYTSPEMAEMSRLDIDTRSDIYALGVLLYELLTGQTPFDAKTLLAAGWDEMRRTIQEQEPVRPSTRLTQELVAASRQSAAGSGCRECGALTRRRYNEIQGRISVLRGDLDWIVMKCLEKDRTRRYETANGLATDIERHLSHQPVIARPPSTVYRAQKFIRRNKVIVMAAGFVALALLLGIAMSTWQAVRASRLRVKAEANEQKAIAARMSEAAQRQKAEGARAEAETQRRRAEQNAAAQQRENYYASIGLAHAQIEKGDINVALETLLKCPPEYRHWEWGWLLFLCFQDALSFQAQEPVRQSFVGYTVLQPTRLMRFSPEGDRLATLGGDGSVKVWNSTNASLVFSYGSTSNPANAFAWHPASRQLAAGMSNGLVVVWNTESWQEVLTLRGQTSSVNHLVYSPAVTAEARKSPGAKSEIRNSKSEVSFLATASANGPVKVWDAASGQERYTLRNHPRPIAELSFSPDGQRLIVRSATSVGGDLGLYEAKDGAPVRGAPPPHRDVALFAAPSGEAWLTIDAEGKLKLWREAANALELVTIKGIQPGQHRRVFFSPDGTKFCNGGEQGTARVWETRSGRELLTIPSRVYTAVFSPDGSCLVTLGAEHVVHYWDLGTGRELRVLRGHSAQVDEAAFSPDGRLIATRGADGLVKLWSALPGREVLQDDPSWVLGVSTSPDGRRVFSALTQVAFNIWDAETGQVLVKVATGKHCITASAFSPDGRRVVTAGRDRDRVARVWDVETGQHLMTLAGHKRSALNVAYSPDGRWIVTGSWDGTARLWEAETGRAVSTLNCQTTASWSLSFSPDSRRLATAAGDTVQLWEVSTAQLVWTRKLPTSPRVEYFPDGQRLLVSRPEEGAIEVWDAATGAHRLAWKLPGRLGGTLSPDGKRLVMASTAVGMTGFDNPLLELLDVETGRILLTWQGHSEGGGAWFTRDGRRVISSSLDRTIRQWESFPWREAEYPSGSDEKSEIGGQKSEVRSQRSEVDGQRTEVGDQESARGFAARIRTYADKYWRERLAAEKRGTEWLALNPPVVRPGFKEIWPPRDSRATSNQLDLSNHYTGQLDFDFNPLLPSLLWEPESDLAELPKGTVTLGGVVFDVRGVIQLRRADPPGGRPWVRPWELYPVAVKGIAVGRSFRRLQVLHAASCVGSGPDWSGPDGATIASYVLHYADGQQHAFDVVYGQDVREWYDLHVPGEAETTRGKVVWRGETPLARGWGTSLRLYLSTWENPRPGVEVTSIDYVSKLAAPAPFLVAMTTE